MSINSSSLTSALAADVEAWDDDDDWESEGLIKADVVASLRSLPSHASSKWTTETVTMSFDDAPAIGYQHRDSIALSPGVSAGMHKDGTIASLELDLTCPAACKRLAAAFISRPPTECEERGANFEAGRIGLAPVSSAQEQKLQPESTDEAMSTFSDLNVEALTRALATEVDSREDEDDWESEGLCKATVLAHLRKLPPSATCVLDKDIARLQFLQDADSSSETIDLIPGVVAQVLESGKGAVASLELELHRSGAVKRLLQMLPSTLLQ